MPRAIWTGSISFGLVTIPVKLLPAVRPDEDVHFHFVHAKDHGRIKNVRRCEVCGKEVGWSDIVRGFEYEKGKFVVVEDDARKALLPEATQSVEIQAFVDRDEIDPILFDVPYYVEPEKRGRRAYALLRDALVKKNKVGIAQVVLRTRAHLAVLSPSGDALVVELLHYPHEIVPPKELDLPPAKSGKDGPTAAEMKSAQMLIDAMVTRFDPAAYRDDYEDKLRALLEARAHGEAPEPKRMKAPKPTNVVDLAAVLERSLAARKQAASRPGPSARHPRRAARRAS